jgi:hypothetical protein
MCFEVGAQPLHARHVAAALSRPVRLVMSPDPAVDLVAGRVDSALEQKRDVQEEWVEQTSVGQDHVFVDTCTGGPGPDADPFIGLGLDGPCGQPDVQTSLLASV